MAVVTSQVSDFEYIALRSINRQLLQGVVRWPYFHYPQATSIIRTKGNWISVASGTAGDQYQVQLSNLDKLADEVFLPLTCAIRFKSHADLSQVTDPVYSHEIKQNGNYTPYLLNDIDLGTVAWPDRGSSPAANIPTRVWEAQAFNISDLRSWPIEGADMANLNPTFSWEWGAVLVAGDNFFYALNLSFVGFPKAANNTGSLYSPQLYLP